ncbi:hypothetical protein Tco_1547112 [Tanacetum coccineum]
MTTPRTPVTSRTRIFIAFIILPDSKDEDTILPVKSAPEIVALSARVETLEQQNRVTRVSLRIATGRITLLQLRAVAAEQQATDLQESHTGDRVGIQRAEMTEQDVKALQIPLGAAQMDITDLLESRRADRLKMTELRSRAEDIEAIL